MTWVKKNFFSKSCTDFCSLLSNFCDHEIWWQYHEIYATWSSPKLKMFLQKLSVVYTLGGSEHFILKNSSQFLPSSATQQSNHLDGCHATDINFCLTFFHCFTLFKSITPSLKSNMNNSCRIIPIKINIIKVNIINIYTKNTHFMTEKCDITRIFINKDYIILENNSWSSFLIILLITNQSGKNFDVGRKASTALSYICCVLHLSRQYSSIKGSLATTLSYISWVLHRSGTNCIAEE